MLQPFQVWLPKGKKININSVEKAKWNISFRKVPKHTLKTIVEVLIFWDMDNRKLVELRSYTVRFRPCFVQRDVCLYVLISDLWKEDNVTCSLLGWKDAVGMMEILMKDLHTELSSFRWDQDGLHELGTGVYTKQEWPKTASFPFHPCNAMPCYSYQHKSHFN